jgi:hypothetical protein
MSQANSEPWATVAAMDDDLQSESVRVSGLEAAKYANAGQSWMYCHATLT